MKAIIALLALATLIPSYACDMHGVTGIAEDNELWIGPHQDRVGGITEEEFNQAIDEAIEVYAPVFQEKGATLNVTRKWNDGTVNAYASRSGSTWNVAMFGGLARHEKTTRDGFLLVVCHEIGHHLGGAPKKSTFFGSAWATNEGQADYWGNAKCMRRIMQDDDNIAVVQAMDVDPVATAACETSFANENEKAICIRGAMAGLSLANLLRAIRKTPGAELSLTTPDTNIVTKTNDAHPAPQCRLDSYYQGALCQVDFLAEVSNTNQDTGVCSRQARFEVGLRPACWLKPTE